MIGPNATGNQVMTMTLFDTPLVYSTGLEISQGLTYSAPAYWDRKRNCRNRRHRRDFHRVVLKVIGPTQQTEAAFLTAAIRMLHGLPYVWRYAWFALPAVGDSLPYGLYKDGDTPTDAGKAYKAAG